MHSASDQLPLFSGRPLQVVLDELVAGIPERVGDVAEPLLRARSQIELARDLAADQRTVPLEIDEAGIQVEQSEFEDPHRAAFSGGGPSMLPWLRVTVTVPFKGDSNLWKLKPSTFTTTAPLGVLVFEPEGSAGVLRLIFEQPPWEPLEKVKAAFERQMDVVRLHLQHQCSDLARHEQVVQARLAAEISKRRSRLTKRGDLADLLGIASAKADALASTPASDYWDVFVPHASEDKESFARPLAEGLRAAGLRVWFDESTLKVGDSLRRSIDRGLAKSRFGVVVISHSFLSKEWPQRELDGLVSREEDGAKVVLPVWHNVTAAEVRSRSPTLADRLAIPSSRGLKATIAELVQVIRPA